MATGRLTNLAQTRLDYWNELVRYMRQHNAPIIFNAPNSKHQLRAKAETLGSGRFILVAEAIVRPELRIGVGVEISGPKEYYSALENDKSKIQAEIDNECGEQQKLLWKPETDVWDIWSYQHIDFFRRKQWTEQHEWLCKYLEAFRKVLKPRINNLLHAAS